MVNQLSFFTTASSSQYQLGITENYLLTHEYNYINTTLVEELWEIDYFYDGFIDTQQGDRLEWLVYDIDEEHDFWRIHIAKYGGENLDQFAGNFSTKAFKTPELLANETFEKHGWEFTFIPMDGISYLSEFSAHVPEDQEDYCIVNGNRLILNDTAIGGFRTYVYEYDESGLRELFYLYDLGRLVFQISLISHGPNIDPYITAWTTLIIIGVISAVALYVIDRRKKKPPMHELHAIMRNARN